VANGHSIRWNFCSSFISVALRASAGSWQPPCLHLPAKNDYKQNGAKLRTQLRTQSELEVEKKNLNVLMLYTMRLDRILIFKKTAVYYTAQCLISIGGVRKRYSMKKHWPQKKYMLAIQNITCSMFIICQHRSYIARGSASLGELGTQSRPGLNGSGSWLFMRHVNLVFTYVAGPKGKPVHYLWRTTPVT
jgi:hypothetical protein